MDQGRGDEQAVNVLRMVAGIVRRNDSARAVPKQQDLLDTISVDELEGLANLLVVLADVLAIVRMLT